MSGGIAQKRAAVVVDITKGRRIPYGRRPETDTACPVAALTVRGISETDRSLLCESNIRRDINNGDPSLTALRKCHYVLENAEAAFSDPAILELTVARIVGVIRDYGEPEGVPLLHESLRRFSGMEDVRKAVSDALSRIGGDDSYEIILASLQRDLARPDEHLTALRDFAYRYPEKAGAIAAALEALHDLDKRIQACARELRSTADGSSFEPDGVA